MGIEELFYDNVPEDGEWHRMTVNVKIEDGGIYIDKSTAGIIVDDKRVD